MKKKHTAMNDPTAVHCMFDIETLGSGNGAPIVQIAAVLFNPWGTGSEHGAMVGGGCISATGTAFDMHVDFDTAGIDKSTLLWWMAQGDRALQRVFGRELQRYPMSNVLSLFKSWSCSWGRNVDFWWSDMDFDLRLMRSAWAKRSSSLVVNIIGIDGGPTPCPYGSEDGPHRGVRDCRTVKAIGRDMGLPEPPFVGVEHDACDDAHHQAVLVSNVLRKIIPAQADGVVG